MSVRLTWLIVIKLGNALQAPIIGKIFECEKIRNLGNSSLKSRKIRAFGSRMFRYLAITSLRCQRPRHVSPDGVTASCVRASKSFWLIPLKRDNVASRERVFVLIQLWSLKLFFTRSWPLSTACWCNTVANAGLALSSGVSPSWLAIDTSAPLWMSSSAMAW